MSCPVLEVRELQTHFATRAGIVRSVDRINFQIGRGEILGLVGESGSGKSVTGFSIMGLIDPPGEVVGGQILLNGRNLVGIGERQLRRIRGRSVSMIFQDPMMTLTPVLRIDTQMIEAVLAHEKLSASAARARARDALLKVGIPAPDERLQAYPHQLSGGMRQRVAIAIALLHRPDLIIADEPTTALDVTIQSQILSEVQALVREQGTSMLWITHDLAVVSSLADRLAVMYAGRIVEQGGTDDVIANPMHPYTLGLLGSLPSRSPPGRRLNQIPGMTPSLANLPPGCAFFARCDRANEVCRWKFPLEEQLLRSHGVSCHNPVDIQKKVQSWHPF